MRYEIREGRSRRKHIEVQLVAYRDERRGSIEWAKTISVYKKNRAWRISSDPQRTAERPEPLLEEARETLKAVLTEIALTARPKNCVPCAGSGHLQSAAQHGKLFKCLYCNGTGLAPA